MKKQKIQPIIKRTAEALGMPEEQVEHVVMYSLAKLKESMAHTLEHPKIRLYHFGSFEISRAALRSQISALIQKIRESRNPEDVIKLNKLLKLRHKAYEYSESRQFKKRFGSWHYKSAGGEDTD